MCVNCSFKVKTTSFFFFFFGLLVLGDQPQAEEKLLEPSVGLM